MANNEDEKWIVSSSLWYSNVYQQMINNKNNMISM